MPEQLQVERFEASNGAIIFRIPLEVFSAYIAYANLVVYEGRQLLIDTGSGFGPSHKDLLAGLQTVTDEYGFATSLDRLDTIIITHGHVDHFGGLTQVK